jgi:hypothetical protein
VATLLVDIGGYWVLFYWWILVFINGIILVVIGCYSIDGYWCLLMVIILLANNGYSIGGY